MKRTAVLLMLCLFAVLVNTESLQQEGEETRRTPVAMISASIGGLRSAALQSVRRIAPFRAVWTWASGLLGTRSGTHMWSFWKLPISNEELHNEVQALGGGRQEQRPVGLTKVFFGAMVARSVACMFVAPVMGPGQVLEAAAMVVGLAQAYIAEHLKNFSDLYLMYKTANKQLKHEVVVYADENDQLRQSNGKLERSLQQLEIIRGHLQEMVMIGGGTAESMQAAVKKIEEKTDETIRVLESQKISFEKQREAFERQEAACLPSRQD